MTTTLSAPIPDQIPDQIYDIVVIGGGINGCGIARDAAGRGFSVFLVEMNDLASGTSSSSTKLIHGGLRYLEHFRLRLVREALIEREVLWSNAPHIIWPLRFVLPHHSKLRPRWVLRVGLFLYDHLGGRKLLPPTITLDMAHDPAGAPLKPLFKTGFEYSDCWVDDARLVALNARDAADRNAVIQTRSEVTSLRRIDGLWRIDIRDDRRKQTGTVTARLVVNASGPWVDHVVDRVSGSATADNVRLVQGSHIVVPKIYDDPRCYIFQNADRRIIFAIPFEDDYTLIGTTDHDYDGDPGTVEISAGEIDYLCSAVSEYFTTRITPDDVVWAYSGVRPLFDDGASDAQEATRDYKLQRLGTTGEAVLVNIFGGKITTYRKLSEAVLEMVEHALGRRGKPWTAQAPLPGGDFPQTGVEAEIDRLTRGYSFLDEGHLRRLLRTYGTRTRAILGNATSIADLGRWCGADLYEVEVRYLITKEWAQRGEDILWRRTKRGLKLSKEQAAALDNFVLSIVEGKLSPREDVVVSPETQT